MIMVQRRKHCLLRAIWIACFFAAFHGSAFGQQPDALRAGFHEPPATAKVRCYWWWLNGNTTADTITRDLEGMKAKGFGGALLVDADGSGQGGNDEVAVGPAIGSPQWMALFVHALDIAQRLGLEISLNVTSRWDVGVIGGPTVTPADTIKLLTWSRTTVENGGLKKLQLPSPSERNGFYIPIAVLAYPLRHGAPLAGKPGSNRTAILDLQFKSVSTETGISMTPSSRVLRDGPATVGEEDTEANEIVDLSTHIDKDGTLEWNFPSGTWEVLRIGYTDTTMHLVDAAGRPLGMPLDVLSADAFDNYWRDAVTPLLEAAKPYIGTSLRYLVTDSWEAGGANWTSGFREEFQRRRGYDPIPYLPIVTGRIITNRDTSDRFLFDLRRTVADLIAENYYDRFADHAKKAGLGTHPEAGGPHGAPIDALENFRSASFPQTEFWVVSGTHRVTDNQRFFVKEASSAAHIYGKTYVAAEGPTSMNPAAWSESLGRDVQPAFDYALTEGLNRLFWHEFTSSPAKYGTPGQEYFAGTHLNPNVTWWDQAPSLLTAFNRALFLMQQGQPVSDLLYFYGDQVPEFVRARNNDPAQVMPGYDYDVVDEDALLHRMKFLRFDLHTPEGIHYRALALPASDRVSVAALKWIERFVHQGGVIIGPKPAGTLGLIPAELRAQYAAIANTMWAGCDSTVKMVNYGQGHIYCISAAREALATEGLVPDFSYQIKDEDARPTSGPALEFVHRRTASADIYFVRSTQQRNMEATLSFRTSGLAPEIWATDDGSTAPAPVYRSTKDGRTEIPLSFSPMGSIFVIFERPATHHLVSIEKNGSPVFPSIRQGAGVFSSGDNGFVATGAGAYTAIDPMGAKLTFNVAADDLRALTTAPWTLSFPAGWGAPEKVSVDHFKSWTEFSDPGIRFFSGTATYHTVIHLPAGFTTNRQQMWLRLGDLREIATVIVNGHEAGSVWRQPFAVRIDGLTHPGDNAVEIRVSNLWPNRLIGDLQPSDTQKFTHTNVHAYTKDSSLLPSGILEPITIEVDRILQWQ